ncbi:MAG TPA: BTAD domain-containing putative transcriptional regulator [Trueperaceae bacterium]|nr:BTAD domain-containing putative transcriptional regulator [Trueperaceae bacterium]
MLTSFRPQADNRYLSRPRLIEQLPEESGFVVLLEAPYGYGKSVLASQWAKALEDTGWRVAWVAVGGGEPRSVLAAGLGLPGGSPWGAVLDALWSQPTLVVLEDLESLDDHESLVPLLRDVRGLVLLASRVPVTASEMPRLVTSGRLTHLRSSDLGFTDAEAVDLFADAAMAKRLWARSSGWPLPLHFASLTGDLPEDVALLNGMRASLSRAEWDEALLLATVPQLPADAAERTTESLAASGFVQLGEHGYRLHALVAESIVASYSAAALAAVKAARARLPKVMYGEALELLGDEVGLAELLEVPRQQVYRQAPEAYLRWDSVVAAPPTALRHITIGAVHKILGQHKEAVGRLHKGLAIGGLEPDDELFALKELCWSLALVAADQVAAVIARGERLLDKVDPELAGRFLSDASFVDMIGEDYDAAAVKLERSLEFLPEASPFRNGTQINLALNRWDEHGDYDGRLAAQTRTLPAVWRLYPSDAPGQCRDVAMLHWWAGDMAASRSYLEQALLGERANPPVGLEARAGLAAMEGDNKVFPQLLDSAGVWLNDYTVDVIAMHAINTLPATATLGEARLYFEKVPSPGLATAAFALRLAQHGDRVEAVKLVDEALATYTPRAYQLYLMATRYRVTREAEDIDRFIALTNAGARLLPGLVPLGELPQGRPELSAVYPLDAVLASGWKAAVRLRLGELPDIEVALLGKFELRFAGRIIELTERHKQLVVLLLLGLRREEVAEAIWPEVDPAKQRNNLGVQFSLLRRVLEPWGVARYVLEDGLKHVATDHSLLLRALEDGDAESVIALYKEPFAPGLSLEPVEDHRGWLRERALTVLLKAADATEPVRAVSYLVKVLEVDPLNEEALRSLLQRLVKRGRLREAQRHYSEFSKRLSLELGLEPLPETRALLEVS